jgi:hypothetical protein
VKHYVYTAAQTRTWHRMLLRMVRRNRFQCLVEYGQLDLGGES